VTTSTPQTIWPSAIGARFVIWRKTSFGSQSERGDQFIERVLTVVTSCRKQARELFSVVVDAVRAKARGHAPPSILSA
jgi:transposase